MKKVLVIPLDERPCNYRFIQEMPAVSYKAVLPPENILGNKKIPANFYLLKEWIKNSAADADCIVLSMDMLIYGGIVPSRLHNIDEEEIKRRIDFVDELKQLNPNIVIYAFQLIMRCPGYSLSDEEPGYYDYCGAEIHQLGECLHLEKLGQLTCGQQEKKQKALDIIKPGDLKDYLVRREKNSDALMYSLQKVKENLIDYFIIPQDDSSVYGFTALDQIKVRGFISQNNLQFKAAIYPGADEVGMTLLSRYICLSHGVTPKIYVHYASSSGANVVPSFEDRKIDETVKYQIMAAGGLRVYSLCEADILLAVNIGGQMDGINDANRSAVMDVNRNLAEYVNFIEYALSLKKAVAVADVAVVNGGDLEMVKLLGIKGLLYKINSYAGWNTSSNTIGTTVCQCVLSIYETNSVQNENFLTHRYAEDVGYCSFIRKKVTDNYLLGLNMNYFDVKEKDGAVAKIVSDELNIFIKNELPAVYEKIKELRVTMPWKRMFEIDLRILSKSI